MSCFDFEELHILSLDAIFKKTDTPIQNGQLP